MSGSILYHFCSKNRLSQKLFSNPFPKTAQIVNLKNPDLELMRRIHPECGFYGFMIRFWIYPPPPPLKKRQHRFWNHTFRRKNALNVLARFMENLTNGSLRKHPFLLALRRWERFARRNVCDSATEIPY